ncbi:MULTISPECIES: MBL fold metallo-hydrolase [Corynebacterium]|jgi:glyoxylase-like metal-dependent hydrolase (beta-lactamase superfamily II)|uniref:MBL fold metallo-hydrolase n=1 Tax=Corynebacterium TaxID=1716 RepID=UPI001030C4E8|nr:MBL fold metallo-hydrolase [Corynebacterium neomassiliense]MCI1256607.1 MBL fold metallo-hydrolase [Corynebacterium provencense]
MITSDDATARPGTGTFSHLSGPREAHSLSVTCSGSGGEIPVTLVKTTVGDMDNNCYLITAGGDALLIDAADDATHLLSLAEQLGVTITDVLTTHRHSDHVRALAEVLAATGARHHSAGPDAPALPSPSDRTWGDPRSPEGDAGEPLAPASPALSELGMLVVLLRGHTPGGLALYLPTDDGPAHLFTGDSLFPGGVGNTASPEDFRLLLGDVTSRCFRYPDTTAVHPGHGDDTTLGAERPHLDEWRDRGW